MRKEKKTKELEKKGKSSRMKMGNRKWTRKRKGEVNERTEEEE